MAGLDQASAENSSPAFAISARRCARFAPVIARMPGWCLGGGLEVAACCEFRIAAHDAKFGMPEVRVRNASVIHAALLPRLIGWGRARWLLMTAETIDASTALAWGLVDAVAPQGGLDAAVEHTTGGADGMRAGSAARAERPAPAMGRAAAGRIRQSQHRRVRPILPHRRAAGGDAGLYRPEKIRALHPTLCLA